MLKIYSYKRTIFIVACTSKGVNDLQTQKALGSKRIFSTNFPTKFN